MGGSCGREAERRKGAEVAARGGRERAEG